MTILPTPSFATPIAPRTRWTAVSLEGLFLVGSASLLLFPNNWSWVAIIVVLLNLLTRRRLLGYWRISTIADPFLVLLFVATLIGIGVSTDAAVSMNRAAVLALGWLCYETIIVTTVLIGLDHRLLILFAGAGIGLGVVGLLLTDYSIGILIPFPALYDNLPRLALELPGSGIPHSGGLINPRATASALLLMIPINLVLAFVRELSGGQRVLHLVATLVLTIVLVLSQTPQAIIAVGGALAVLLIAFLPKRLRLVLVIGLIVSILMGIIILFSGNVPWAVLLEGRGGFGLVARLEIWIRAIRMIESAPFTGIGLNGYAAVMDAFYPGYILGPEAHAHNVLLQTLTDQGILGGVAIVGFTGCALYLGRQHYLFSADQRTRLVTLGIIATLVSWMIYGLVDVLSLGNKVGILLWLLFALPIALSRSHDHLDRRGHLWGLVATVSSVLLLIGWLGGGLGRNLAIVSAQQALSPAASRPVSLGSALHQLAQVEAEDGIDPHRLRLKSLLLVAQHNYDEATGTFRELALREAQLPLWWWAPAPVLTGEMRNEPTEQQSAGLLSIYRNWHIRFPERVEPIALLASLLTDTFNDSTQAQQIIEAACLSQQVEQADALRAILTRLALPSSKCS